MTIVQIVPLVICLMPEFILFAFPPLGVALFHRQKLWVSLIGLASILAFKLFAIPDFNLFEHMFGQVAFTDQILNKEMRVGEWSTLLNLLGLLIGFSILSRHFEDSVVPATLPNLLPNDWKGPLVLLIAVFIISSFLDNIAAALIGGSVALVVFNRKVHLGYISALLAASKDQGSGQFIGYTKKA